MERYNLIVYTERNPRSALILGTPFYLEALKKNPDFRHENIGDFYSRIPANQIAGHTYNILRGFREAGLLQEEVHLITTKEDASQEGIYVVRGRNGAKIFHSHSCEKYCEDCINGARNIALGAIASGLSEKGLGSIPPAVEQEIIEGERITRRLQEIALDLKTDILMHGILYGRRKRNKNSLPQ